MRTCHQLEQERVAKERITEIPCIKEAPKAEDDSVRVQIIVTGKLEGNRQRKSSGRVVIS